MDQRLKRSRTVGKSGCHWTRTPHILIETNSDKTASQKRRINLLANLNGRTRDLSTQIGDEILDRLGFSQLIDQDYNGNTLTIVLVVFIQLQNILSSCTWAVQELTRAGIASLSRLRSLWHICCILRWNGHFATSSKCSCVRKPAHGYPSFLAPLLLNPSASPQNLPLIILSIRQVGINSHCNSTVWSPRFPNVPICNY